MDKEAWEDWKRGLNDERCIYCGFKKCKCEEPEKDDRWDDE